ncbi:hypothetical protein [Klebsiella pneumoniae]|uniref:hypothetical protein n=1 Tax=Klebsiella pneumoniae TaxID=573 RepID=UPI001E398CA1|nr:hypothetical protein [Klebsiella pneumoniae]
MSYIQGKNLAESAPHGIFVARGLEYIYTSGSICPPPALDFNLLNLISDGYYEKNKLFRANNTGAFCGYQFNQ